MIKYNLLLNKLWLFLLAGVIIIGSSCSSGSGEKAGENKKVVTTETSSTEFVGPVKSVEITNEVDPTLAATGKDIFENKCAACHKFDERYVGPSLGGVTERREPAWIMNMILAPEEMTQKDPVAKQLLGEYMTQMVNQNVSEDDARAILEYFRSIDKENTNL